MAVNAKEEDKITAAYPDDEINILDYWHVIWKRKLLILILMLAAVFTTAVVSMRMTNIYQSAAVISPVSGKEGSGGLSAIAQQFGGLPGLSLPGSASSSSEIVNLIKSNVLREKVIEKYNLLPLLFHEKWDYEKKDWKKEKEKKITIPGFKAEDDTIPPTIWDGLRAINGIVKVNNNIKDNTITISAEFYDPVIAAKIPEYFLTALNEHLVNEARRVAETNKKYLEEQLVKTADPLIRQKIYNLVAQQIESSMMAEVKENFAFKVIDRARVPDRKIKPKRVQMIMVSFVTSLFAGIFLAFLMESIQKTKKGSVGASHQIKQRGPGD
ncbi:MAG: hypothetical protein HYR79_08110 [Nitrospirae bacterium]|nr:hypothetical protein [Nitrospirota bacterium]